VKNIDLVAFVPTYNSSRTIGFTLKSILSQSQKPKRVIVIDSGSSDNTNEIASAFGVQVYGPKYWGLEFLGLAKARNRILEFVDSEYLLSVDSDVLLERDYIKKMSEHIGFAGGVAGIGAKQIELYRNKIGDKCRAVIEMRDLSTPLDEQQNEYVPFLLGSNNIYDVGALRSLGKKLSSNPNRPFNDSLNSNYEDADLGEKLMIEGYKLYKIASVLTLHLQKDTLQSYIDRAYRYRVFKWELKGAFRDFDSYQKKCEHNINYANMGLSIAMDKNRPELICPMIALGFNFFIRDAIKFFEYGEIKIAQKICASVKKALNEIQNTQLKKLIKADNSEYFEKADEIIGGASEDFYENIYEWLASIGRIDLDISCHLEKKSIEEIIRNSEAKKYNTDELCFEILGVDSGFLSSNNEIDNKISMIKDKFEFFNEEV
jgi:glycosyltransferase involved in cell wall biosynthesis